MYGTGLFKGLGVTFKHWFSKEFTEQYPEERPDLPPASQGFFDYKVEKCISCGLCVRACPNQVIHLESEKDENNKKMVKSYTIDFQYCLLCGLCIEACPTAALVNANNFELACYTRPGCFYELAHGEMDAENDAFDKIQTDYWNKKRPGGHPVQKPEAVKGPPVAKQAASAEAPKKNDSAGEAKGDRSNTSMNVEKTKEKASMDAVDTGKEDA